MHESGGKSYLVDMQRAFVQPPSKRVCNTCFGNHTSLQMHLHKTCRVQASGGQLPRLNATTKYSATLNLTNGIFQCVSMLPVWMGKQNTQELWFGPTTWPPAIIRRFPSHLNRNKGPSLQVQAQCSQFNWLTE